MAKMRVYELAREMGMTSKALMEKLAQFDISYNNHMSTLDESVVDGIKTRLAPKGDKKMNESPKKTIDNQATTSKEMNEQKEKYAKRDEQVLGNKMAQDKNQTLSDSKTDVVETESRAVNEAETLQNTTEKKNTQAQAQNRPYQDRPNQNRPNQGGQSATGHQNRPYQNRPNQQSQGQGSSQNRPHQDRPNQGSQGSQGQRPAWQKPGDRQGSQQQRPYTPRPEGAQGQRTDGQRPYTPRPEGAQGQRPDGQRQYTPRPDGQRPYTPRPDGAQGQRPYTPRPEGAQGSRPEGQRPYTPRPDGAQGSRPYTPRPDGQRQEGQRPYTPRPAGAPGARPDRKDFTPKDKDFSGAPRFQGKQDRKPKEEKGLDDAVVDLIDRTNQFVKKSKKKEALKAKDEILDVIIEKELSLEKEIPLVPSKKGPKKKWHQIDEEEEIVEVKVDSVKLPKRMLVSEFASAIGKMNNEIILKLMNLGVMAAINQYVDYDTMCLVAEDLGVHVEAEEVVVDRDIEEYDFTDDSENLVKRAPVVTVMGHVDHGKTSLLDAIRTTNVSSGEAGGITQHIGASEVVINGEKIVFLDTPGHEAFTSLRARGAKVTDIAVLVVAADDGVMPQTIEAIDHARSANVPIIVAINKIDKPTANVDNVMKDLANHGVLLEDWGGDVVSVQLSAKQRINIEGLLEMILLVAEMQDLKANPSRNAVGTVIEANIEKGRGAVATILIQNGTLSVGDPFVCGTTVGKVRALYNYKGKKIKKAGPSSAVEVIGMTEIATAGDRFFGIDTDKEARQIAENRSVQIKQRELDKQGQTITLEDIFNQIQEGKTKTLNLILKADVHGSLEAIKSSLEKLNNDEVKVNIHHSNIGAISETDIMLATASKTVILGFNVRPSSSVIAMAKKEGVEIRTYQIIYNLINDVESAMKGMLDPVYEEIQTAEVEVRATFKLPNNSVIAGGYVLSGKVERNSKVRLLRQGIIIHDGKLSSLRRFKDDVKEVASGYECGIGIENYNDLKEGDIIEAYELKEIPRKL